MHEETFAPIAPMCAFETEEEAIALANQSPFGLSAYVMTRDVARIFRCAEPIEAGTLGVNDGAPTTSQAPFGGVKHERLGAGIRKRRTGRIPRNQTRIHRGHVDAAKGKSLRRDEK